MQQRLTATILGVVVGALLLIGAVTFALAAHAARLRTRAQLVRQAVDVAAALRAESEARGTSNNLLQLVRVPFKDENDVVLIVSPAGKLVDIGQPRQAGRRRARRAGSPRRRRCRSRPSRRPCVVAGGRRSARRPR